MAIEEHRREWGDIDDELVQSALRELDGRLRAKFGERYVKLILFGSRARGDHKPDSDADVAVVMRDKVEEEWKLTRSVGEETYDILLKTGLYIEPWLFDDVALADPKMAGDPQLLSRILGRKFTAMSTADYMVKANDALSSARILLANNQGAGAANRAYYAMFEAARAALHSIGESGGKTHASVIGRFGARFVKDGPLSPELGRVINDAQRVRIESDYGLMPPDPEAVRSMVAQAEQFVAAVRSIIPPEQLQS